MSSLSQGLVDSAYNILVFKIENMLNLYLFIQQASSLYGEVWDNEIRNF